MSLKGVLAKYNIQNSPKPVQGKPSASPGVDPSGQEEATAESARRQEQEQRRQAQMKKDREELRKERESFHLEKTLTPFYDRVVNRDSFNKLVRDNLMVQGDKVVSKEDGTDAQEYLDKFLSENEYLVKPTGVQGTGARQPTGQLPSTKPVDLSTPEGLTVALQHHFGMAGLGPQNQRRN